MKGEAIRWLDESLWDLETATVLHREKRYNAAVFYAHQAAEKAVKALLYYVNEAPWGHSVRVLLERYLKGRGLNIDRDLLRCARELDRHYIPSRYPNAHPGGTPHEAYDEETSNDALKASNKIIDYVKGIILHEGE